MRAHISQKGSGVCKGLFLACLAVMLCAGPQASASETARMFLEGIQQYKAGDYERAASAFSAVAETGVKNGKLFYNLGNAYLKNGDIGRAVLWYERALNLIPDDPDLKFNRAYALSLTKDEKSDREFPVLRILFFWKHALSKPTIRWVSVALNLLFWLTATGLFLRKKRAFRTLTTLLLAVAVIFTLTAFYNYYEDAYIRQGIILPDEAAVRSGLSDDATELFRLHAGTRVEIDKAENGFFRIFFSEGKIGWIRKSAIGVI